MVRIKSFILKSQGLYSILGQGSHQGVSGPAGENPQLAPTSSLDTLVAPAPRAVMAVCPSGGTTTTLLERLGYVSQELKEEQSLSSLALPVIAFSPMFIGA